MKMRRMRFLADAMDWLRQGRHAAVVTICSVAILLSAATPYSYFVNPERGLYVIFLVVILFIALFSVLGSAEHEQGKFGIEEAVMGQTPLLGHKGGITTVDVSSGSHQRIVSGSYDGTVRTWALQTGSQELVYSGHTGAVFALAVSKSGFVVSGGIDRTIQVWDIDSGAPIKTLLGHNSSVLSLKLLEPQYSFCGEPTVLSGGQDGTVIVWSLSSGSVIRSLVPEAEEARDRAPAMSTVAVSCGPDPIVVAGSSVGLIFMWSLRSGAYLGRFEGHFGAVLCVAVSSSVKRPLVVSCSVDWTVRVWDLRAATHVMTLEGHSGAVGSVTICGGADEGDSTAMQALPSGCTGVRGTNSVHLIVSGGRDSTVRVWDLFTGELYITLEDHSDSVCAVALSMSTFPPWGCEMCEPPVGLRPSPSSKNLIPVADLKRSSGALCSSSQLDRIVQDKDIISTLISACSSVLFDDVLLNLPPQAPQLTHSVSSGKKSNALIITGGVEASIKVWDLERIKRDLKWNKRKSWAVLVSIGRKLGSSPAGSDKYDIDMVRSSKLAAMTVLPGFRKFIHIDDLCGEVATYF